MAFTAWLASSLVRQFPARARPPRGAARSRPALLAPRGGTASLQAAFIHDGSPLVVACGVDAGAGVRVRIRRVAHVPLRHFNVGTEERYLDGVGVLPGLVPDPLIEAGETPFPPRETCAYWITLEVAPDARAGERTVRVQLTPAGGKPVRLQTTLRIGRAVLAPREGFPVTHWFHVDCLADQYRIAPYSDAFWPLLAAYLRDYVAHGSDTLYTPLFTPPLDGVRKPEAQLLRVHREGRKGDAWRFDWSRVERWVAEARRAGVTHFEWTHLFTQWGAERALRVYDADAAGATTLWAPETPATDPVYRRFLAALLPELERFLDAHGLKQSSLFHISDEPHGDKHVANYRAARALIAELAPWMRVMDALSDVTYAAQGLLDTPVPIISSVEAFREAGHACWAYYCCWPRGAWLNRLLDTPLPAVAMHGFLLHRSGVEGFLHWGYNYWYRSQTTELIDPYQITDAGSWPSWCFGDPCMVYPGPDGPVDSIRWEITAEALQDLALLRQHEVPRSAAWLRAVQGFDAFPRDERWLQRARRKLLDMT